VKFWREPTDDEVLADYEILQGKRFVPVSNESKYIEDWIFNFARNFGIHRRKERAKNAAKIRWKRKDG